MNTRFETRALAESITRHLSTALDGIAKTVGKNGSEGALARGKAFALAGYIDEAIESYQEALSIDCHQHEAAARLALMQMRANLPEDALDTAARLASIAPTYSMPEMTSDDSVNAFTILGNALVQNGRVRDSVSAYQQAMKEDSTDTAAAARLAQVQLATGNATEALRQQAAVEQSPRFRKLAGILALGAKSEALLPRLDVANIKDTIYLDVHGRPVVVDGEAQRAEVRPDDDSWC